MAKKKNMLTGKESEAKAPVTESPEAKAKRQEKEMAENAARPKAPRTADRKPASDIVQLEPWDARFVKFTEPNGDEVPALWLGEEEKNVGDEVEVYDVIYVFTTYAYENYRKRVLRERRPKGA